MPGMFHARRAFNDLFGRVLSAFFPTAFRFQQICHLGHHRRNRSEAEMFDYYRPGDNVLMKYVPMVRHTHRNLLDDVAAGLFCFIYAAPGSSGCAHFAPPIRD